MQQGLKSPEKPKRKRQSSGEGRVRRNSQSKGSPVKAAVKTTPVKNSPTKSSSTVSVALSLDEPLVSVDGSASDDIQVASPVKATLASRRASRVSCDVKEEKEVKPGKVNKEGTTRPSEAEQLANWTVNHNVGSESEVDSTGECTKKMVSCH